MNWILTFLIAFLPFCRPVEAIGKSEFIPPTGKSSVYRITLVNKAGTPFSLDKPQEYLSLKAIERRKRQHIEVDSTDLPISPNYVRRIAREGAEPLGCSKWCNTLVVSITKEKVAERIAALPFVREVKRVWTEPQVAADPSERVALSDTLFTATTESRADELSFGHYGPTGYQIALFNGMKLHEAGFRGEGMTIAIIDGGFMNADRIPALQAVKVVGTGDFVRDRQADIFAELDHGTKVLSLMATCKPDTMIGTAPAASYWLLRSEDDNTETLAEEDYWVMAAEYADSAGVDLINSSLGYHNYDDTTTSYRYGNLTGRFALVSRVASMLASKGIILVNSAGNSGRGTWKKIGVPADADAILAVGALTRDSVNAEYSSVGPSADGRVKPDVMALGDPWVIEGCGTMKVHSGTSFAAPLVCGMVACLWQALPEKTAYEIIDIVRRSADNYATPDNIFGYGIPDFWKAYQANKTPQP